MRRGQTLIEILTVLAMTCLLATALGVSVVKARQRATVSAAMAAMEGLVEEISQADDQTAAVARARRSSLRDPWGRPYRITLKDQPRTAPSAVGAGTVSVRLPNALCPREEGR